MKSRVLEDGGAGVAQIEIHRLEGHVRQRLGGCLRGFRVRVGKKGLILEGHVPTYYAKQLAQHLVMEATKFRILANDIEVNE